MQVDFLIIGQGLAGSLLARGLRSRGLRVVVVDDAWKSAASQVAAGLMTPLTGRRFTLTKDYPELFAFAREALTRAGVFRPVDVYRMFVDEEQRRRGLRRVRCDGCRPFVNRITGAQGDLDAGLTDAFGGALMHGAWVDLPKFLSETRRMLEADGVCFRDNFEPDQVAVGRDFVEWKGIRAAGLVYCDGYKSAQRGPFRHLAWQPVKGEALNLTSDAPQGLFMLNREGWALPLGQGRWRTGTNWQWDVLDEVPTEAQRRKLLDRFRGYFKQPVATEVTAHVAGVRPCTQDSHPFLGTHPEMSRVHLFNGLGPRGTVWAPQLAEDMVDYLVGGKPLRPEVDLRRTVGPRVVAE